MKKLNLSILALMIVTFIVACAIDSGSDNDDGTGDSTLSDTKEITAFSFEMANNADLSSDVTGTITDSLITAGDVPFGSARALVATFTTTGESVAVGEVTQESGVTANDFIGDVTYTVTSEDESTASYVVSVSETTFTPSQSTLLHASDASEDYNFGSGVAIDGDMAVVGAPGAAISGSSETGALYVFERDTNGWTETDILYPSNPEDLGGSFGEDVDIIGNVVITGDSEQNPTTGDNKHGAVYIFEKDSGAWTETILEYVDTAEYTYFGSSVAVHGNTAVIGGHYADPEGSGNWPGAVFVYKRASLGNWDLAQTLTVAATEYPLFGRDIDFDGETIIVAAPNAMVTDGSTDIISAGKAYVYEKDDSDNWALTATLVTSDVQTEDGTNLNVAIYGSYAMMGTPEEDGGEGDPSGAARSGAVYIFKKDSGGAWTESQILRPSEPGPYYYFGASVSVDGNGLVVGESDRDIDLGNQSVGAAYIYQKDADGLWQYNKTLLASDRQGGDHFGGSTAMDRTTVLISSYTEDGGENDPTSDTGAVYIFE